MDTTRAPSVGKITEAIHEALAKTYLADDRTFIKNIGGDIHLLRSEAWSERDSHGINLTVDTPEGTFEYAIHAELLGKA